MSPRKLWLSYLAVLAALIIGAIVLIAKPAHADDAPVEAAPTYPYTVHQDWYKAGGTLDDIWPQSIAAITCGGIIQHDNYTITTPQMADDYAALLAAGTLASPAGDSEFSPNNYDVEVLLECPSTPPSTAPTSPPPSTTPTTPPAPVTATPSATPSPATPTSTPTTAAPTSVPASKPTASAMATETLRKTTTAPSLAYTGSTGTWLGAIVAGLLVLSGIGIVIYSRKKEDIEDDEGILPRLRREAEEYNRKRDQE